MRIHTETVVVPTAYSDFFAYVTDPDNLTRWSVNFILHLNKQPGGRHRVKTPQGELGLEIRSDQGTGTIDMVFHGEQGRQFVVPTRAVPLGGDTLYLFTLILPDLPPDEFEKAKADLREELRLLREQASVGPNQNLASKEAAVSGLN